MIFRLHGSNAFSLSEQFTLLPPWNSTPLDDSFSFRFSQLLDCEPRALRGLLSSPPTVGVSAFHDHRISLNNLVGETLSVHVHGYEHPPLKLSNATLSGLFQTARLSIAFFASG